MADISWPTSLVPPSRWALTFAPTTTVSRAAFGNALVIMSLPGVTWRFEAQWSNLTRAHADPIRALLLRTRGGANALLLYDFAQPTFRGVGGGSPVVNGGGQSGNSLAITGATPSTTNWAMTGDKIQVGPYLYMIVADASTDASGNATLTIEPPLRASPAHGTTVVTSYPRARFAVPGNIEWAYEGALTTMISVSGIELP